MSTVSDARLAALRACWHPVAYGVDVTAAPRATTLLDEPLALWRDARGAAHAFRDACVHRGTALSLGRVEGDEIVCAYHGWRYRADGACTAIPQLAEPARVPARARAVAYSTVERYGIIWVALEAPLAHREAEEPPHAVHRPRHGPRGEPVRAQGADELREVRLAEVQHLTPRRAGEGAEARQVAAVGHERVRGQAALDAQVVEVLPHHRRGRGQMLSSRPYCHPPNLMLTESRSSRPSRVTRWKPPPTASRSERLTRA